jgi:ankyrin repeat protein
LLTEERLTSSRDLIAGSKIDATLLDPAIKSRDDECLRDKNVYCLVQRIFSLKKYKGNNMLTMRSEDRSNPEKELRVRLMQTLTVPGPNCIRNSDEIRNAIMNTQFDNNLTKNSALYFINQATLQALLRSTHPIVKEWGERCRLFSSATPKRTFVDETTGLLRTPRFSIHNIFFNQTIQGFWHINKNYWQPVEYPERSGSEPTLEIFFGVFYSAVPREHFPESFDLLSPMHVAALICSIPLMEMLLEKGMRLEEDLNLWRITPLEVALSLGLDTLFLRFLLPKSTPANLVKALKFAVEKGSFPVIEVLLTHIISKPFHHHIPITDEIMEIAKVRSSDLYQYLEAKQDAELLFRKRSDYTPLNAMRSLLNYSPIPLSLVVKLLCEHPNIVTEIVDVDGNTFLHNLMADRLLVAEKKVIKVKALMSAIYEATLLEKVSFDREKKNKAGQTVLQIALNTGNKDLIAAVILYGEPSLKEVTRQISCYEIDFAEINTERNHLREAALAKTSRQQRADNRALRETNGILRETNQVVAETREDVALLAGQQAVSWRLMAYHQIMIQQLSERVGFALPPPPVDIRIEELPAAMPQPPLVEAPPIPPIASTSQLTFFDSAPQHARQQHPSSVTELQDDPADDLRNIIGEMAALKDAILQKQARWEELEREMNDLRGEIRQDFSDYNRLEAAANRIINNSNSSEEGSNSNNTASSNARTASRS